MAIESRSERRLDKKLKSLSQPEERWLPGLGNWSRPFRLLPAGTGLPLGKKGKHWFFPKAEQVVHDPSSEFTKNSGASGYLRHVNAWIIPVLLCFQSN
jgi:hypothetical protein